MYNYVYKGAILYFDKVVVSNWIAETYAVSKDKAMSNFKYQAKKYLKLVNGAGGIYLPGAITVH